MKNQDVFKNKDFSFILLLVFVVLIILSCFVTINSYPLYHPSEGRYAEIARNIIETNNWITPQLDQGKPFWGKPPLSFWLTAISFQLFGISEFSARIPSLLLNGMSCFFLFLLGVKLRNRTFGIFSVIIFLTSFLGYLSSGWVLTDTALSTCVTVSLLSFVFTLMAKSHKQEILWGLVFFVGLGLSVLAKGLIGIVLIGAPLFFWTLSFKEWKTVWQKIPWVAGSLLFLSIAVPWHVLAEIATPGFLRYYFYGEHFQRFLDSGWQGNLYGSAHAYPHGTILLFSLIDTFPWNLLLAAAFFWIFKRKRQLYGICQDRWLCLFIFWFITPLIIFTFASNILYTYVLPSMPAFAILATQTLYYVHKIIGEHNLLKTVYEKKPIWFLNLRIVLFHAAFVPLVLSLIVPNMQLIIDKHEKQKRIAQVLLKKAVKHHIEPVYISKRGYTVSFYANGKILNVDRKDKKTILYELYDDDVELFVVRDHDFRIIPSILFQNSNMIYRMDEFTFWLENRKSINSKEYEIQ